MDEQEKKPYKAARYVNAKGKKYIEFSIWNEDTKKLERIRDYRINKYVGTSELKAVRAKIIREINELLVKGAYKSLQDIQATSKNFNVRQAFDQVIKIKKASVRHGSYKDYKSCKDIFIKYLEEKQPEVLPMPIRKLSNTHLMGFFEWLQIVKGCSPSTINTRKTYVIALLNTLVEYEYIEKNPFVSRKLLPVDEIKNHTIFTDSHYNVIKDYLKQNNPQLFNFFTFMLYSFARPNEVRQLRVKWINFETNTGHVPAHISKNRCPRNFEVLEPLRLLLISMGVDKADPEFYIFGKDGCPGLKKWSRNHFTEEFKTARRAMKLPDGYTLYSAKHYGVTKHFLKGFDFRWIQDQAGFKDLETLQKYLRSLSLKTARTRTLSPPSF